MDLQLALRLTLICTLALTPGCAKETNMTRPDPPIAKRVPHELVTHGHRRVDHYYWLRDDKREDEEILDYLRAENAYTESVLAKTRQLQDTLFKEIKDRIKKDDASVPYLLQGYWYYTRFETGKEYPIHCRKKGSLEATEEILLDANIESTQHDYYSASNLQVSQRNDILAYAEDTLSRRIYTIRFKHLATGQVLADQLPGASGALAWAADNRTLYYVKRDATTLRAHQLWRHQLGADPAKDRLVYEETDDTFSIGIHRSKSRQYLILFSSSTLVTEARVLAADDPTGEFAPFLPREANHEYSIGHAGDQFYIRTNWNAQNFRLMSATLAQSQDRTHWKEVIPQRSDVLLEDFELFKDHLVVSERTNGLLGIRIIPWEDPSSAHQIEFGESAYTAYPGQNPSFDTPVLRYHYQSLITPSSIYDYDMNSRETWLRKQDEVLGGYDPQDYHSERIWATARDGARVAISIVHRKDLDRSMTQPLYQYGYGSYGASMDPGFSAARLSLLERGMIYAMVHIRGGQEMGRQWYENGKLLNKRNTFSDFIDCSKHLIQNRYTTAQQLVAVGRSAGGLLVGAVANMAPELYKIVIAGVPFVDVVTTMLDESIPLTTFEYDEWGNPNENTYYDYMLSYSPYDQVEARAYPHMLVMTGLHDSQVQYWEPAKWVAKLRHHKHGDSLLLLHTNLDTGHGGASGRFRRFRETALEFAFILDLLKQPE